MRRSVKLGFALVPALALGGSTLAFEPLVLRAVDARAAALGAVVAVGSARPGWGVVRLRDVRVKLHAIPAATLNADLVEISVGAGLGAKAVRVSGGRVELRGTRQEISAQIDAWRAARSNEGGARGDATPLTVDGVYVVWDAVSVEASAEAATTAPAELAGARAESTHVWGARYSRIGDVEAIGADLARTEWNGATLELRGLAADLTSKDGSRAITRVGADGADARVRLGGLALGEITESAPVDDGRSGEEADADVSRGERLRTSFRELARTAALVLPAGGEVDLSGLYARLEHGDQALNVGPGRLRVGRDDARLRAELIPGDSEGRAPLTFSLDVPLGDGEVRVEVEGGPVTLASLGVKEGDLGLTDVGRAQVSAKLDAKLAADGSTVSIVTSGRLSGATVREEWLAAEPVSGVQLGWQGRGDARLDLSRLRVEDAELDFGGFRASVRGEWQRLEPKTKARTPATSGERDRTEFRLRLEGGVPLASCQGMLDSIPAGLAPLVQGVKMTGTFALEGRLDVNTTEIDRAKIESTTANECRITEAPAAIAPSKFSQTFTREVVLGDRRRTPVVSGPGQPGWAPLGAISPHMQTAVLVCEDGRFFSHRGFDEEAIRNSIRENVRMRRFFRGASTISMQLAKNLYLPREKTLSRKLQEGVLTLLLEQSLTKHQMMELYLNVIEYGPGIYGIGPAAAHYFSAHPSQLSLGQSLYLASILSNPKVQHFAAGGAVTPGWSGYLRKLMHVAKAMGRVTDEELDEALTEQVTFGAPVSPRIPSEDEALPRVGESTDDVRDESLLPEPGAPRPSEGD